MKTLPTLFARSITGAILEYKIEIHGDKYRAVTGQQGGNLIEQAFTVCEPKNSGKLNSTSPSEQAEKEALAKFKKKLKEGYFEDVTRIDEFVFVQPQLAETYYSPERIANEHKIILKAPADKQEKMLKKLKKFEKRLARLVKHFKDGGYVWVDYKFDGVRDETTRHGMFSRTGEPCPSAPHIFQAVKHLFEAHPDLVLDGELYSHDLRHRLNEINSLASKKKPTSADLIESEKVLRFYVYDAYGFNNITEDNIFSERKAALKELIANIPYIVYVESTKATSMEELDRIHEDAVEREMEGTMIKFDVGYEHTRSDDMWKRKDFMDDEFTILRFHLGDGKKSTMAAKATALLPDGREFDTNIKGDFKFLTELWENQQNYIGKKATIRFLKYTEYGIPYIPYIIVFRNDLLP